MKIKNVVFFITFIRQMVIYECFQEKSNSIDENDGIRGFSNSI